MVMPFKCGYCGQLHTLSLESRQCALDESRGKLDRQQIAEHGRGQIDPYPKELKASEARNRRSQPSPGERTLQRALKKKKVWFKREHPLLGYVVDFYFPYAKLVVEVDGSHHQQRRTYDSRRDEILKANHYQVLRFNYADLETDLERITNRICAIAQPKQKQASDNSASQRRRGPTAAKKRGERHRRGSALAEAARDLFYEEKRKRQARGDDS
jgi:very-short-patch-repair endonuclease